MCEVLYTIEEGGYWNLGIFDEWSEKNLMLLCEAQALPYIASKNKVRLTKDIKAAAVMFHSGVIWDAILSGYVSTSYKLKLPKCFPNRF